MEDEQLWQRLLDEQTILFRKINQKNADLKARVVELERELTVWKAAFASNDEEKATLKKQVIKLERNIGSLKEDNPIVLCLIDGDGNIFSKDLICQGRSGGTQAAQLLTKGITDHLTETEDGKAETTSSISGRAQIWVSVYCNKSGLQEMFISRQFCTADQFESFITGFNQASPLFSVIDVGTGKEAADTKIKECFRVFTRFPQTSKVFFGGAHDNGYASTLNSLNNEGLLDKIVLLRGYKELAFEIEALQLPVVEITGIFMTQKLAANYSKRFSASATEESESRTSRSNTNSLLASPAMTKPRKRLHSNTSSNSKFNPPACNFYYLAVCKAGTACRFGHDYELEAQDLTVMRVHAKKSPCGQANRNQSCTFGDRCPLGHICPSGPKCKFYKAGKCKFVGIGMHDAYDGPTPRQDRTFSVSTFGRERSETQPVTPEFAERVPLGARISATPPVTPPNVGPYTVMSDEWPNSYVSRQFMTPVNEKIYFDSPGGNMK